VTTGDVQRMLASAQATAGPSDAPLLTRELRDRYKREKEAKWTEAVIRVNFPDRHVLQFRCHPQETLQGVYQFVRGCLVCAHILLISAGFACCMMED
jgi:tether containing UBX domain for GLUT4